VRTRSTLPPRTSSGEMDAMAATFSSFSFIQVGVGGGEPLAGGARRDDAVRRGASSPRRGRRSSGARREGGARTGCLPLPLSPTSPWMERRRRWPWRGRGRIIRCGGNGPRATTSSWLPGLRGAPLVSRRALAQHI
jgi:hypothetical protein